MGRPVVQDKLRQIPVPVRQSIIDRIGKETIIAYLKEYVKTIPQ